jgi:hypothetical protein
MASQTPTSIGYDRFSVVRPGNCLRGSRGLLHHAETAIAFVSVYSASLPVFTAMVRESRGDPGPKILALSCDRQARIVHAHQAPSVMDFPIDLGLSAVSCDRGAVLPEPGVKVPVEF